MFYTLTLNPAIDQLVEIENFQINCTNKVFKQYQTLGGKGINAAIMLKNWEQDVIASGFLGFENKNQFCNYLQTKNIKSNFIIVPGAIRINLKIKSLKQMHETELNCLGFQVQQQDEDNLLKLIKDTITSDDYLIIGGSIPQGCSNDIYAKIAAICAQKQIKFALDTSKKYLEPSLKYQPLLIKPNLAELNEIFNTSYEPENLDEIIILGKKLQLKGAQNVLISFGSHGSLLVANDGNCYLSNTVKGQLISSVGAGDSMVATFCAILNSTNNYEQALKMAAAAGAATAFSATIGEKELIEKLAKKIVVKKIMT